MSEKQTYEPYRSTLLSRSELEELSKLRPAHAVRGIAGSWGVILLTLVIVAHKPVWWVVALAMLVIGMQVYALLIIAHDGLHRRLFDTIKANDLWNDLFILGSIGAITRINRLNHMRHHAQLALPSDPDRFKYSRKGRESASEYLFSLSCIPLVFRAIRNVLSPHRGINDSGGSEHGYTLRDVAIIAGWQCALIATMTMAVGWWAYPILWVCPVVFALCCDISRVFCEHSQLTDDVEADKSMRLVSYDANFLERVLFAPNNMNHHIAHHLWPVIAYYRLPQAEARIREKLEKDGTLVWRSSYFGYLWQYWKAVRKVNS